MMFKLQVDSTFSCGKGDRDDMFLERNFIDLGDILSDKLIEKVLGNLMPSCMPSRRS